MANSLFLTGKHAVNTKAVSVTADTLKATLLLMNSSAGKITTVSAASNATPIVLTVASGSFITNGDICVVGNVGGNLAANGTWQVTVSGTSVTLLTRLDGNNSTGSGAYTSGGYLIDLSAATTLSDVSGNSYGTDQTLSGVTDTLGTVNASSWTWTALTAGSNKVYGIAIYDNTSNNLLAWYDGYYQIEVAAQASSSATTIYTSRLAAIIPSGTVIYFSDGSTATTSAQNAIGDMQLSVNSLAATVHQKATADVGPTYNCGLPFLPNGGSFTFTPDTGANKLWTV